MPANHSRIISVVILILILIYGILRVTVLRFYGNLISNLVEIFNLPVAEFLQYIKGFARKEEVEDQAIGWLIYYPSYFLLHIAFIFFLFSDNIKARKWLVIGLTGTIGMLILCWQLFSIIEMPGLANFFRGQFRNLFGLPFILLAIEGGRILYQDLKRLTNLRSE